MADTKATIQHGDEKTVVPTTYLLPEEARLLRTYKAFLTAQQFHEVIICPRCFEDPKAEPPDSQIRLSPDQVVVLCPHELLFAVQPGPSLFADPPDLLVEPANLIRDDLSYLDHHLLLRYKHFLQRHRRREILFCRQCEMWGREPGMRAVVTDAVARFECRHRILELPGSIGRGSSRVM